MQKKNSNLTQLEQKYYQKGFNEACKYIEKPLYLEWLETNPYEDKIYELKQVIKDIQEENTELKKELSILKNKPSFIDKIKSYIPVIKISFKKPIK
jgi:chromosome segregation ATPase